MRRDYYENVCSSILSLIQLRWGADNARVSARRFSGSRTEHFGIYGVVMLFLGVGFAVNHYWWEAALCLTVVALLVVSLSGRGVLKILRPASLRWSRCQHRRSSPPHQLL